MQEIEIGTRYGMLTTTEPIIGIPTLKKKTGRFYNASYAKCVCDCGNMVTIRLDGLKSGRTLSCGCLQRATAHNQKRPLYGVGINDCNLNVFNSGKTELFYDCWSGVICRGYSNKWKSKHPTYEGVSVCKEWLMLSNFKRWFDENYNPETMQGWHLDKDILVKGNKLYSPNTCCFVPQSINTLFALKTKQNKTSPIGVSKVKEKYVARLSKYNKLIVIGTFDTLLQAFNAYKQAKEAYIKEVADEWKDKIAPNVYEAMYNYKVEITD